MIGIALAKSVFAVHRGNAIGKLLIRPAAWQDQLLTLLAQLPAGLPEPFSAGQRRSEPVSGGW